MTRSRLFAYAVSAMLLTGCASTPEPVAAEWTEPGQAVLLAAGAPRLGIKGQFVMTVKAIGSTRRLHLNSERDYRDPRNLSISVEPAAAAQLAERLGPSPQRALLGHRILVTGTARRTRIDFTVDGRPSGKYYYQTHVGVTDASQIQLLSGDARVLEPSGLQE